MNEMLKDCAMAMLAEKIVKSKFERLEVRKIDGGMAVGMEGETFGIVGAIGASVADLSKSSEIPLDEMISFVAMAAHVARQCADACDKKDNSKKMMEFFTKCFNKEGDK